jgi:DNA-directed RNA polymerase subunit RPC12/RpoP
MATANYVQCPTCGSSNLVAKPSEPISDTARAQGAKQLDHYECSNCGSRFTAPAREGAK